jgi:hypothetical protein
MKHDTGSSSNKYRFKEASDLEFNLGSALAKRIEIRLEEHSVSKPLLGNLVAFILDKDYPGKGWYLVYLEAPAPVYSDPVDQILVQSRGGVSDTLHEKERKYDIEGREIIHYYRNPLEEMLLNPQTKLKYVLVYVATIRDKAILVEGKLSHDQVWIHPFAKALKPPS